MDDNNDPNKISMNNFEQVQSDTKKEINVRKKK